MTDVMPIPAPKRLSIPGRIWIGLAVILTIIVAAMAVRYLIPGMPGTPAEVRANSFLMPFLPIHAGLGAIALVIGPFQFLPALRRTHTTLHRMVGTVYVLCCLISGSAGLVLAFGSSAGPLATLGFGLVGVFWIITTGAGAWTVATGQFAAHRRWMIRSYALTFAAVTLRLYLPIGLIQGWDFQTWFIATSFLSWVPNLIVAEFYLLLTGLSVQNHSALRSAA